MQQFQTDRQQASRVADLARQVAEYGSQPTDARPLVFFNASTRLTRLSLNAAFSLLAGWSTRLDGAPVIHFACRAGLTPCVLGTQPGDPRAHPPCRACIALSERLYAGAEVRWLTETPEADLQAALRGLDLSELESFCDGVLPLGRLVLPSLRWILRRHHLDEDAATLELYRRYIVSARRVARQFAALLDERSPRAVVVFNGTFFPEATARYVAEQRGIRVVTHEVALQPLSAFFTQGEATAYPIDIPAGFELNPAQDARLDAYLEQRLRGNFSMAGIRFWPEMRPLDEAFWQRAAEFRQVVPVFTNVVFDTSQGHANVVFETMFAWLDEVLETARRHPETFFVLRAHPDESRPGKESRESVTDWVARSQAAQLPNLMFVPPQEYFSSYELISRSKFVMVYNSTIGMEASIMGAPVLCAGKARFTQLPTVYFPQTAAAYRQQLEEFLAADRVPAPAEFKRNARRFLYYQLFRSSLPFEEWIEPDRFWRGYVGLKDFTWQALLPGASTTMQTIHDGLFAAKPFLLDE